MSDRVHSQVVISGYVRRLHLESGVLGLTLLNKIDDVLFNCSEVMCALAHFQLIF